MPQNRVIGAQFRFQADSSVKKRSVRLGWDTQTKSTADGSIFIIYWLVGFPIKKGQVRRRANFTGRSAA